MMEFDELPKHFASKQISIDELDLDPFEQLIEWFKLAKKNHVPELNAMALATASKSSHPSCRMVLLKKVDPSGLIFYTNYNSRKARELKENPYATGIFFWAQLSIQICVEGKVEKISQAESIQYFQTRSRESQIAAWSSNQGEILSSKKELELRFQELSLRYENQKIPLPPFWGGYRMIPHRFEFWQGGSHRLHDRFQYLYQNNKWELSRLSP